MIAVYGYPCHITAEGITTIENVPDQIRVIILTNNGDKKIGMVIQYLDTGIKTRGCTTHRLLLCKITLPFSKAPDLIIKQTVNFGLGQVTNIYSVIDSFMIQE